MKKSIHTHMHLRNHSSSYGKWEYLLPALAIVSLLISCVMVSSKKYFWNDELYSYYFTSEPSLWKMLVAFHDKINNTPIFYFLLGWGWDKLFSSSELSLRLFSSLGICVALAAVWFTLRRTYSFWATAIGTLGIFCTSQIILSQNAEARMYGLFLALSALALLLYDQLNRAIKPTHKLLLLNSCLHIGIVHTHLFGGFYSGAILVALLLTDRCFKLWRPKVYLSVVLSWVSILFYIPSFLNQSDAGKPRTWIPMVTFRDLVNFFNGSSFIKPSVISLLVVILVLQIILSRVVNGSSQADVLQPKDKQAYLDWKAEVSLLIFAAAFIIVPVFVWLISTTIKPMFWGKYMIPSALGFTIILAYLSSRLVVQPSFNQVKQHTPPSNSLIFLANSILLSAATGCLIINPILVAKEFIPDTLPGNFDSSYGYTDLPIVVQPSQLFTTRLHYSDKRERYYYVLDWPAAVSENSGLFGPQEYKHLDALNRNYPVLFENVVSSQEFLNKYDKFLIVDYQDYTQPCSLNPLGIGTGWENIHCPQWVETKLLQSNYKISILASPAEPKWKETYNFVLLLAEKQNKNPM